MKTEINVEYTIGYRSLIFSRMFYFDFVPFVGMVLTEDSGRLDLRLENDDMKSCDIFYNYDSNCFEVYIRTNWGKFGTSLENMNDTIDMFKELEWTIKSSEKEIDEMSSWIKNNY